MAVMAAGPQKVEDAVVMEGIPATSARTRSTAAPPSLRPNADGGAEGLEALLETASFVARDDPPGMPDSTE